MRCPAKAAARRPAGCSTEPSVVKIESGPSGSLFKDHEGAMSNVLRTTIDLGKILMLAQIPFIPFYVATLWAMLA